MVYVPKHEEISEVEIVQPDEVGDDIKIVEEVLTLDKGKEAKPGARLKKFKEDLRLKLIKAKNEEWKQKEENEREEEEEEAKCMGEDFYEGLPDEEEILDDEESAESEPEEDDIPIVESRRRKCEFGDEEADESECEDDEEIDTNRKREKDEDGSEESDEENDEDEDEEEEQSEEEIIVSNLFMSIYHEIITLTVEKLKNFL